jgi:hypothetical protein
MREPEVKVRWSAERYLLLSESILLSNLRHSFGGVIERLV